MPDIYNRLATDQTYKKLVETDNDIEIILAQIKMILGTMPGDVLGSPNFGLNLSRYIFSMSYNQLEINELVLTAILNNITYDSSKYLISITVDFGKDANNSADYAVINISINDKRHLGIVLNLVNTY